jgi:hypothetical protein
MALRRTFELKRDEVPAGWRKLLNEELHDLYSSPSIIRLIKLRRMRFHFISFHLTGCFFIIIILDLSSCPYVTVIGC